ncbi:hypothetical protein Tco_0347209 [Tanacetum coccineum]
MAYWALKHANFDLKTAGDHRKLQLNELNELRDQAYENSLIYKERTKKLHDLKIKNRISMLSGPCFLLFNSRLKVISQESLNTRGSGPLHHQSFNTNVELFTVGPNFKVNGHRVKHYFGGTDNANITRNRSKPGKHGHETDRVYKSRENAFKRGSLIQVIRNDMAEFDVIQGPHWLKPKRSDTRAWKETHGEMDFYTKVSVKEAQMD